MTVDAEQDGRLGELAVLVDTADNVLVIDHHQIQHDVRNRQLRRPRGRPPRYFIAELFDASGQPIDVDIARRLYAG